MEKNAVGTGKKVVYMSQFVFTVITGNYHSRRHSYTTSHSR